MAIGTAAALVGSAAIGAIGASRQAKAQKDAAQAAARAAEFRPFAVNLPGGRTTFAGQTAQGALGTNEAFLREQLSLGSLDAIRQAQFADRSRLESELGGQALGLGGESLLQGFQQFQGIPDFTSGATNQFLGQTGGLAGQVGAFGQAGLAGLLGAPNANPIIAQQFQQGQQLLGSQGRQFEDVAAERLGLLREQAQPQEQRQFNQLQQNLFSTGRMGTTGGALQTEAFARGLGQADVQRQLASQDLGQQLAQQSQQNAIFRQQLGGTLLGQSLQGVGQEQLQARGLGALGLDASRLQHGILGGQLDASRGLENQLTSRAAQRIQAAEGLFGFGSAALDSPVNRALQLTGATQTMDEQLRNQIALGGNLGGAQATAGANVGRNLLQGAISPGGSFLQGLGQAGMTAAGQGLFAQGGTAGANRDLDALFTSNPGLFGF